MEFLYTKPSNNENISYTLVSLINHDINLLDCGNYISDAFDANTGIWWHFDDANITQISDLLKGVYIRESHRKKEKGMSVSTDVLIVVYIITSHLKNTVICFSRIHQHVQNKSYEERN